MNILNTAMILEYAARRTPDRTCIIAGEQRLTFAQVDAEARRFANVLARLGVEQGQKVALLLPNAPVFVSCYYGALKLGAVPVPLGVTSPGPEIAYFLKDSDAVAVVAFEAFAQAAVEGFESAGTCQHLLLANLPGSEVCPPPAQRLAPLLESAPDIFSTVPTSPSDVAVILYTAGTTGQSKGVALTHFNYDFMAKFLVSDFWRVGPDDVILMVAPASHIFGQTIINAACAARARLTVLPRFEPEAFLRTIEKDQVTFFAGVPTLVHFMLNSPLVDEHNLRSLRHVMIGGAPLHPGMAKRFVERFQVEMITGYGLTEGVPVTFLNSDMYKRAPEGSIGLPAFGTTVRIVDGADRDVPPGEPGEIIVRGPQMFTAYYNRMEESAAAWRNGWFHTGDMGRIDEHGYVYIVDRVKDMIKRSGYAVSPAEIERVLLTHPAVAEAAVIGVPDEALGEEIKAFVALKPGANASAKELIAHCKTQLAAYKYPRLIEFRDSLPKNSAGKVLRRALREH